jgi:hypothetical protein
MPGTQIGQVSHFYDYIHVASIVLTEPLHVGDTIHFLGHSTDFKQKVTSIQIELQTV